MSDSETQYFLPPLDKRLRALYVKWQHARACGQTLSARDLCPDDDDLAAKLQAFLDADEQRGFVNEALSRDDLQLESIGPYKVIRHIGQGGSSNVYLCEQSHPRRQVALKLLKISQFEDQSHRRFQFEIDLLAALEHPAIARIFDAGLADIGRGPQAYYTMEYVEGLQLDHFLESKLDEHLCTADRIKLFLQIADAVQCAHEQGIVHRDLKPSNILITESGSVKVIDFGLARMSDSELTIVAVTKTGHFVGTPLYMSPEQFSPGNQVIDARSDLYSLGVVLYQMLTGQLPYDLDEKSVIEIANKIVNEPPQPLSRVDTKFRGDLEIIVGKTLEKDPAHRYQSLAALADDLQRFLDGLPILAKRPSAIDPILRWGRQNPWTAAGAGAGAATLLVSFILAVTWMLIAERRAGELSQMFVRAIQQSHLAMRHARDLELANVELQDAATRLQRATTNSTLMRATLSTENNPRLTRSLLFDTNLIPEDQRGFAWKVLQRQSNWEHARGKWMRGPVLAASFSADGSKFAAAGVGAIDVRHSSDMSLVWSHADNILHPTIIALDSTGQRIAYQKPDRSIFVFDNVHRTKHELASGNDVRPVSITWSPSDQFAIGLSNGTVRVWSRGFEQPPREFRVGEKQVVGIGFRQDEKVLGAVCTDGVVQLVNLTDGALEDSYSLGVRGVLDAVLDSECRYVAAGRRFHYVKGWDLEQQSPLFVNQNPGPYVTCAVFTQPRVQFGLATRSRVELVRPGGKDVFLNLGDAPVRAIASSPDGSLLLVGDWDGNVILFRTVQPGVPRSVAASGARISDIRFLDSGNSLVVCGDQQTFDVHDVVSGHLLSTIPKTAKLITDVETDADATTLYYCLTDGTLASWNVQRQEPGAFRAQSDQRIVDIAVSADGNNLFGISRGGLLTVFQVKSNHRELHPTGHEANGSALALTLCCNRVFTADDSGTIKCWDTKSFSELHSTSAGTARIHELAIDPSGKFLAAASGDGLVRVLDSETLVLVAELIVHTSAVRSLDFSPDGKTLATGGMDSRVILWDTGLWQPQAAWDVDGTGVRSVRFSPDGNQLAVAGNHDQVMIWEVEP